MWIKRGIMSRCVKRHLIASARKVIRWCTPEKPWLVDAPWMHPGVSYGWRWIEPSYVASLVLHGVPELAREWTGPLHSIGFDLTISGVFCHQSPKVEMEGTQGSDAPPKGECELGDLLIIHDHKSANGEEFRRAVLVQAKMDHASGHPAENLRQYFLYRNWPDFKITRPRVFAKRIWNLRDNSAGARYGFINLKNADTSRGPSSPWALVPTSNAMTNGRQGVDLAVYLVNMLEFNRNACAGRKADVQGGDPWSDLIKEMLKRLELRKFRDKQLLGEGKTGPRVTRVSVAYQDISFKQDDESIMLSFVCAGALVDDGDGGDGSRHWVEPERSAGISTILIETSERRDATSH